MINQSTIECPYILSQTLQIKFVLLWFGNNVKFWIIFTVM